MTTLAPVRADTLPENVSYRDDGCDVSPSCLRCPLVVCKYDDPGWLRRVGRLSRDLLVMEVRRREGLSVSELAARFGLSARTIHRIIQSERAGALGRDALMPESPMLNFRPRPSFKTPTPLPPIRPRHERRYDTAA